MAENKDVIIEQIKELGEAAKEGIKSAEERLSKQLEEKAGKLKVDAVKEAKELIDAVKTEVEKGYTEEITTLKTDLKKTQDDFKKYQSEQGTQFGSKGIAATISDAIMKELKKPESREEIKRVLSNGSSQKSRFSVEIPDITLKAVHTMARTDVTGGDNQILSTLEPGTIGIARRRPFMRNIVNVGTTGKEFAKWVEKTNVEGGAGMTAEGAKKSQSSFQWVTRKEEVRKVTDFIKVTKEALEDIDEAEADIRSELVEAVELKLDEQFITGDGTGDNIKGIGAWATAFAAGALAGTYIAPSEVDVISAAAHIMINNNFQADVVLISPLDAAKIASDKGNDNHYTIPPFVARDGRMISGLAVVENPGIAAGTAYVMDSSKVKIRFRKNLELYVGYENDDFTKNLVTFLAEIRACLFVPTNYANALVKIDFATAKTALKQA